MSSIATQLAKHHMFQTASESEDKGITIQNPSTAAFMINSEDRNQYGRGSENSGSFTIYKNEALFNGFFNRLALQEVVMNWSIPNIANHPNMNMINFTFTYQAPPAAPIVRTVTLNQGYYYVADVINALVNAMNVLTTPNVFQSVTITNGARAIQTNQAIVAGAVWSITPNVGENLGRKLFGAAQLNLPLAQRFVVISPDIRFTEYVDIVSPQLTYNQSLKDNTTAPLSRSVLYRWYFSDEYTGTNTNNDNMGFQILPGYRQSFSRRLIPFPKQILWNKSQPIGSVSFQVYTDTGELINPTNTTAYPLANGSPAMEFQMTMLISEN